MPASYRRLLGAARNQAQFLLGQAGLVHSDHRMTQDASGYWSSGGDRPNDSHWRGGSKFAGTGLWEAMGAGHVTLYQRMRKASAGELAPVKRIVDWGCGGGANAVAFAPLAAELTGVDIAADTIAECARQMAASCPQVPFTGVLADIGRPEDAAREIPPCDLFVCLYVLELVPTPEHGLRLMRIAHGLLSSGGQAFVQIKYGTRSWRTRPRRRSYRSAVAGTTYRVEEFWTAMEGIGFRPEAVVLVPRNELDERYAYFLLTKP